MKSFQPLARAKCAVAALICVVPLLAGTLPPSWSQMRNLTILDLTRNELGGPLPSEYVNLANLQTLWLSFNNLTQYEPTARHCMQRVFLHITI